MNRFLLILSLTAAIAGCEPMSVVFDDSGLADDSGVSSDTAETDTSVDDTDDTNADTDDTDGLRLHLSLTHSRIVVDTDEDGISNDEDDDDDNDGLTDDVDPDPVDNDADGDGILDADEEMLGRKPLEDDDCTDWAFCDYKVAQVEVGWDFYCARDTMGYVNCGGSVPLVTPPAADETFLSISVGDFAACGIVDDETESGVGEIECWYVEMGDTYVVNPPSGTFETVSVGSAGACATSSDGTVECWGGGIHGFADTDPATLAAALPDSAQVCISNASYGERDMVACALDSTGSASCYTGLVETEGNWPSDPTSHFVAGSLSCGRTEVCAIVDDGTGTVECWGHHTEVLPAVMETAASVYVGQDEVCTLGSFGSVTCMDLDTSEVEDATFTAVSIEFDEGCGVEDLGSGYTVATCW